MKKYIIVSQSYYSKNKDHGIQTHHFMAHGWGRVETVTHFIFLGSKITADGDCGHERVGLYAGYMLNFWRNCQTVFQSDYTSYIPTTMCEGPATHSITGSEFLSDSLSPAAMVKQQALHHLRRSLATADPGNSLRDLAAGRRCRGLGKWSASG